MPNLTADTLNDPERKIERRGLLSLLVEDDAFFRSIIEDLGKSETEALVLCIRAIAEELCDTSVHVFEMHEKVVKMEYGQSFAGALTSGLLGINREEKPLPEGDEDARAYELLLRVAHRDGADIRHGAEIVLGQELERSNGLDYEAS